jgi:lipoate-protein ligase A
MVFSGIMAVAKASEKVAGGKLVRLELEHDGARITRAKITGDFFMHPEDGVEKLEAALIGSSISAVGKPELSRKLSDAVRSNSLELVGFSAETIAKLAQAAIAGGEAKAGADAKAGGDAK